MPRYLWDAGEIRPVTPAVMPEEPSTLFSPVDGVGVLYERGFHYESPIYAQFDSSLFMRAPGGLVSLRKQGHTSRQSVAIVYIETTEDVFYDANGRLVLHAVGNKMLTPENAGFEFRDGKDRA